MRILKICLGLATKFLCICIAGPLTFIMIVCNWIIKRTDSWFLSADALIVDAFLQGGDDKWED